MKITKFRAAIAAVALLAVAPAVSAAPAKGDAPVTEAELADHIKILSSDAFEGRAPGTEGEDRTIAYVVGEWAKLGLEPVPGSAIPWLQGVPLVETQATGGTAAHSPWTGRYSRVGQALKPDHPQRTGNGRT